MRASDQLTIGQVAQRAGSTPSALRHYEVEGLISSSRDGRGRRVFSRAVLRRLAFVRAAQTVGLSLAEIRQALDALPSNRTPTTTDWQRLADQWTRRLDDQIEALRSLKAGLTSCIGCGCLSLTTCALANPRDVSAAAGSGARFLPALLRPPHDPATG